MKNDPARMGKLWRPRPNPEPTPNIGTLDLTPNLTLILATGYQNGFVDMLQTSFDRAST
jgi:hypothetical protein